MATFNSFTLIGNLAADPELRYTPAGSPICTFPVAVNARRKNSEGQFIAHVDFFRITTKLKLADLCAKHLKKGRSVFVNGQLESWRKDGKFGINFMAYDVQFLGASGGAGHVAGAPVPGHGTGPEAWDGETRAWVAEFSAGDSV